MNPNIGGNGGQLTGQIHQPREPMASKGISYPLTGYPHTARCGKVRTASSSFGHNKGEGEEECKEG